MNNYDEVEGVSELLTESSHSEAHSEASNIEHTPKRPVVDARGDHHEGDALGASGGSGRVVQEAQARTLPENWTSTPSEDPCRDARKLQFSTVPQGELLLAVARVAKMLVATCIVAELQFIYCSFPV